MLAAGKYGAGVLVLGGIDDASLEHHLANWRLYEQTCAAHGHVADRAKWRFNIQIHVAETREQAKKDIEYGLERWIGYSHDVVTIDFLKKHSRLPALQDYIRHEWETAKRLKTEQVDLGKFI